MDSKNINVLMIGTSTDSKGGISKVISNIMNNWEFKDITITHLISHQDGSPLIKLFTFMACLFKLINFLIFRKPNIVHIHFSIGASIYRKSLIIWLVKFFNIPIILHSHTGEFDVFINKVHPIVKKYLLMTINQASILLCIGKIDVDVYSKYFYKSKPRNFSNSVEINTEWPSPNGIQILTVGSIGDRKGTYDLVASFRQVVNFFPDSKLVIVGSGEEEKINKCISSLSLRDSVILAGEVPNKYISNYYKSSYAFVLPSRYEGLPIALLEAMSFGLPVITTEINGIADVIINGSNGLFVEPGNSKDIADKIIQLISNKSLWQELSKNAKLTINNYHNHLKITNDLHLIYQSFSNS